ncbi:pyrroline-5-carboxylate reductase [Calidifontimicrobium sp. SYSU G02091]|uniref:pyrroline-5-carboxylate reductase n=1 Tax=Calidifontimicrobium sp. SYSU G02091 TaxID=2926421 RepID=UPI001F52FA8F|nr:pyrroline-5-carboxylate reductase [Calidifontimicrobium sp. SYSU G02091]MCI1191678.1 pyrroline-5-carboxylate reductase [Calidifontimicrobium sp. SYSU G02091]
MTDTTIAFIGGGNMAAAIVGGLVRAGRAPGSIVVVEPDAAQRERLAARHGVRTLAGADATLAQAALVVWAVKPQVFAAAAAPCAAHVRGALQLSVMAGIRSDAIARATGSDAVVRAMPNTPALIGQGISGLYARPAVTPAQCAAVEQVLAPTGRVLWVGAESDLDAVTALSGSGPAYVFYLVEAMEAAAVEMGLSAAQGRELALATVAGAAALALQSGEPPAVLRERVTSKGGTTHAAITSMEADGVKAAVVRAIVAAQRRAKELGDEFG